MDNLHAELAAALGGIVNENQHLIQDGICKGKILTTGKPCLKKARNGTNYCGQHKRQNPQWLQELQERVQRSIAERNRERLSLDEAKRIAAKVDEVAALAANLVHEAQSDGFTPAQRLRWRRIEAKLTPVEGALLDLAYDSLDYLECLGDRTAFWVDEAGATYLEFTEAFWDQRPAARRWNLANWVGCCFVAPVRDCDTTVSSEERKQLVRSWAATALANLGGLFVQ